MIKFIENKRLNELIVSEKMTSHIVGHKVNHNVVLQFITLYNSIIKIKNKQTEKSFNLCKFIWPHICS